MLRRHALAPVRGLVLSGLSLVGFAQVIVAFVLSFTGVVVHFQLERWLPNLVRRLMGAWFGVHVPQPYRPKPPPPTPEPDGWYREGNQLYRRTWLLKYRRRRDWIHRDMATHRDHMWELATPFTGGLAAGVPALLIAAAVLVPWWAAIPLVVTGFAVGPLALELYVRWSVPFLGTDDVLGPFWAWAKTQGRAAGRLAQACGMALLDIPYALFLVVSIFPGVVGFFPQIMAEYRLVANARRRQLTKWTGVPIAEPYLPPPPPPVPRPDGTYLAGKRLHDRPDELIRNQAICTTYKDKATWRDLLWLVLDPIVVIVLCLVPVLLGTAAFFGYFWSWVWSWIPELLSSARPREGWAYLDLLPGLGWVPRWATPVIGFVVAAAVFAAASALLRLYGRWGGLLLAPTRSAELARRVAQLTETRTDAIDTQAAELRRIERDLHDGAQARWVAMGLNLGAVERLIDQDPQAAKKLLANARNASAEALVELRDLVRGIHPPVLSERGLGDAVRALALDSALDVHVAVDLPGRVTAPVEAAVYFAVNELLTNVGKHARAQRASIDIRHYNERLRVTVSDDGHGGASVSPGGGLDGVRRRLATFDGVLMLNSPPGGPTTVTLEVPCALSSPRTSTSSETA
ncbi:histidine kinase [Actinocrispum sp. NPDC049592]|uniref:sensor histidine kinase n=1 Tax=Actinocrispum sp. NPDC049592 TaxID=3154835 RepID=UPI0034316D2B